VTAERIPGWPPPSCSCSVVAFSGAYSQNADPRLAVSPKGKSQRGVRRAGIPFRSAEGLRGVVTPSAQKQVPRRLKPPQDDKDRPLTAQLKLRPFKAASHSSRRLHTSTPLACAMPPAVCKRLHLHCCLHLRGRGRTIQNRHVVLREQAW